MKIKKQKALNIVLIFLSILICLFIKTNSSSAFEYKGYSWKKNNNSWPQYRVYINYSTLPTSFKKMVFFSRMEWNKKGASKQYFYYSKKSRNRIYLKYEGNTRYLSLTYITHREYIISREPVIQECDTKINISKNWNIIGTPMPWENDLQSVVTHELGHWLSLEHSGNLTTMNKFNPMGTTFGRSLHQDDIDGIQHIYGKK